MAKKKNKGNKKAWKQFPRSWMRRNRGWLSAIGGAIGGAVLLSAITSQRGQSVISELASSAKSFATQSKGEANALPDSASKPKPAAST